MSFSPYSGGPVTIDHENIVKAYSSMLGRGHALLEPTGPVWVCFLYIRGILLIPRIRAFPRQIITLS
jgi:hypothetical protein